MDHWAPDQQSKSRTRSPHGRTVTYPGPALWQRACWVTTQPALLGTRGRPTSKHSLPRVPRSRAPLRPRPLPPAVRTPGLRPCLTFLSASLQNLKT